MLQILQNTRELLTLGGVCSCAYVCVFRCTYVCVCRCAYSCVCRCAYVSVCSCAYVCVFRCAYETYVHLNTQTYAQLHTQTYAHLHTQEISDYAHLAKEHVNGVRDAHLRCYLIQWDRVSQSNLELVLVTSGMTSWPPYPPYIYKGSGVQTPVFMQHSILKYYYWLCRCYHLLIKILFLISSHIYFLSLLVNSCYNLLNEHS